MLFTTLPFIGFLFFLICIYWICPAKYRWGVLLIASLLYDWLISKEYLLHAVCVSLIVFLAARKIDGRNIELKDAKKSIEAEEFKKLRSRTKKKNHTLAMACGSIVFLTWLFFKFLPTFRELFRIDSLNKIMAPVGISFYTLSLISYLIDVFDGKIRSEKNYFKVLLFTAFFPCIIQGPINRYAKFNDELNEARFNYDSFINGFVRVVWGYFKKMVVADRLYVFTSSSFNGQYKGLQLLISAILAEMQLYADFSGGIDITLGICEMLGMEFPKNFDYPFASQSISEYWRRWHITLGNWMRDYIFYPFSLSKPMAKISSSLRTRSKEASMIVPGIIAMLALWGFSALWHGNKANYILWGLYFWLLVSIDTITEKRVNTALNKLNSGAKKAVSVLRAVLTMVLASVGEMISQSDGFNAVITNLSNLFMDSEGKVLAFSASGYDNKDWVVVFCGIAVILITEGLSLLCFNRKLIEHVVEGPLPARWLILITVIMATLIFGYYGAGYDPTPFIYFQF